MPHLANNKAFITTSKGFMSAEINRRLDNIIRFGTIAEVDYATARARVKSGQILTAQQKHGPHPLQASNALFWRQVVNSPRLVY